ncbi:MAG TPA: type II toxin-antitoxin system prevent-host-death family antitoxin [Allocoleopsis sp.]
MINTQVNLTDNPDKIIDLSNLIAQVNQDHLPRIITSNKGDAVLLSKQDWDNLQETIYLQSIPGFVNKIKEIEKTDDWISEAEFMRELDGMEN